MASKVVPAALIAEPSEGAKELRYFRGRSFDSELRAGAGIAVPNVKNTRRSTTPERISTSPIRNSPMVSGRFESDARMIFTPYAVQLVSQR